MKQIDLIVMAAGSSRRFGSNKLLYRIQERPMFEFVLDQVGLAVKELEQNGLQAEPGFSCRVFVVSRYEEILQETDRRGWTAVDSPESVQGASFTIRNGIQAAGETSDYYMFLTADQPCLKSASIVRLIRETLAAEKGIGSMCWQEQPGNPVIFHRKYLSQLLALEGDTGGRKVVNRHLGDCCFCQAGQKEELTDADTLQTMDNVLDYVKKI